MPSRLLIKQSKEICCDFNKKNTLIYRAMPCMGKKNNYEFNIFFKPFHVTQGQIN